MRIFFILLLGLISQRSKAIEARVLMDETSLEKTIVGEMQLSCIQGERPSCRLKNYKLDAGTWLFRRSGKELRVYNKDSGRIWVIEGQRFQLSGNLNLRGRQIQKMEVFFKRDRTHWVAHFPVDQYLYGVMSAEVPVSWPLQALKAQAVASRTYFLFKKTERQKENFDVRSDIMDQVFNLDGEKHRNIIRAVNETHGMVLTAKSDGKIFPAYFHSDCGGRTSNEQLVWRHPSSLNQAVSDPYCKTASKNNWSHIIDKDHLMNLLHQTFYLPRGIKLKKILPRVESQSRAHVVDFLFSNNVLKRIRANELRRLMGFAKLKSTHFEVQQSRKDVKFIGRGYGHGVGMCQWGAQRWARKGQDFRSILRHYYPQATLQTMDETALQARLVF